MVDVDKLLKSTVKKGKVKIGTKETKAVMNDGSTKLVVISKNCPHSEELNKLAKKKKIPVYNHNLNSIDLGYVCGKVYSVSTLAVIEDGGSNILQIVKKR
ncbi:MAG: 50S ribosomal protein L30e [Candidatus Thermoplasmatota archaeon]|nr:50S ribosomal protein L30e [Candidatus Thermoplasmatota archaeon]